MSTISEKLDFLRTCDTSFIGDAFIRLGLGERIEDYCIPGTECGPLNRNDRFAGEALTVRFAVPQPGARTWDLFDLVEGAEPGRVLAMCGCGKRCYTGDIYVKYAALMKMGAFVVDGMVRDVVDCARSGLPVFCRGGTTAAKGGGGAKIVAYGEPVSICGVAVRDGDILVGDADGVIAIPADMLDDVVYQVEEIKLLEDEYVEAFGTFAEGAGDCRGEGENLLARLRAIAAKKGPRRVRS